MLCMCPPSVSLNVNLLKFAEYFCLFPPKKENLIKVTGSVSKIRESRHSYFTLHKSIVSKSEITESQHPICPKNNNIHGSWVYLRDKHSPKKILVNFCSCPFSVMKMF